MVQQTRRLGRALLQRPPSLADGVALAEELDLLMETDAMVRLERRSDAFARRLVAVEEATTALPSKARRRAARALRRVR